MYKYINTYENASFNKANEIYVKTFERYNIHAVYSDNEIGSDVDYIPETNKFIIVEAAETHTGRPKPFNYDTKRFKKYNSKIIYHQISLRN